MCMWKCKRASPCTVDSLCAPRQALDDVREAALKLPQSEEYILFMYVRIGPYTKHVCPCN